MLTDEQVMQLQKLYKQEYGRDTGGSGETLSVIQIGVWSR